MLLRLTWPSISKQQTTWKADSNVTDAILMPETSLDTTGTSSQSITFHVVCVQKSLLSHYNGQRTGRNITKNNT